MQPRNSTAKRRTSRTRPAATFVRRVAFKRSAPLPEPPGPIQQIADAWSAMRKLPTRFPAVPFEERRQTLAAERIACNRLAEAKRAAADAFAELNGWRRVGARQSFGPGGVGKAHRDYDSNDVGWRDHPLWFRGKIDGRWRNVCLIGQPYGGALDRLRPELDATAAKYGLRWHLAPNPTASIHAPGSTLFIVMTMPGIEVRWLPEQEGDAA